MQLAEQLGLHRLAVEDAVQAGQRPKRERFGDVLAVALKTLWYVDEETSVDTGELMLFVGPRYVLTVRHGPVHPAAEAARRLEADPSMLLFGPLSVLHAVLDVVVDVYSEAAETVRAALDRLEDRLFSPSRVDHTEEIYSLKREVREFRDAVQPLVPVLPVLPGLLSGPADEGRPATVLPNFRDVADHLHRTDTEVRTLDELLTSSIAPSAATPGSRGLLASQVGSGAVPRAGALFPKAVRA
ncbi:CorA family divalent cation transporter [Streptomyces sp. NPDC040724]|uniref:CorA family divalent cation transporter n=1 Tax=Streptomyces sp. NPDC040724 TaxID=3155612 RepID=UPI0033C4FD8E